MILYLDLIFILNFCFDFLLLISVSILLRRRTKVLNLFYGAVIGSLSVFVLFIKITSLQLFLFKVIISILMIIISFGYVNIKYTLNNLLYFYTASILLGGFLYYLNVQFSYKQDGLVFFHNGLSVNYILLVILSPIIIYNYIKQGLVLKNNYSNYYKVKIYLTKDIHVEVNGFLDTGNKLIDPFFKKPIILLHKSYIKNNIDIFKTVVVPYNTVNYNGILTCIIPYKIKVFKHGEKTNFLVGIIENEMGLDDVGCILHHKILEG